MCAQGYILIDLSCQFSSVEALPGNGPFLSTISKLNHLGLYAFMIGMPVTGVGMGLYSGKGLPFFWTTLPGFEKPNGKLAGQVCSVYISIIRNLFV